MRSEELDQIRERDKSLWQYVDETVVASDLHKALYPAIDRHSLIQHIDDLQARIAELEQQLRTVTLIDKMAEEGYEHVEQFEIADTAL